MMQVPVIDNRSSDGQPGADGLSGVLPADCVADAYPAGRGGESRNAPGPAAISVTAPPPPGYWPD